MSWLKIRLTRTTLIFLNKSCFRIQIWNVCCITVHCNTTEKVAYWYKNIFCICLSKSGHEKYILTCPRNVWIKSIKMVELTTKVILNVYSQLSLSNSACMMLTAVVWWNTSSEFSILFLMNLCKFKGYFFHCLLWSKLYSFKGKASLKNRTITGQNKTKQNNFTSLRLNF